MDSPAGPLDGVRVIEAGQLLAGPFAGQLMGDLGADVIKVEPPGVGDPMRQWGREKSEGSSLWWPVVGRNKRSVTLNLREPAGQDLLLELVAARRRRSWRTSVPAPWRSGTSATTGSARSTRVWSWCG